MLTRTFLRAAIIGGAVTVGDRRGAPAVTIDAEILDAADLDQLERVEVCPGEGGPVLPAHLVRGKPGSGVLRIDGDARTAVSDGAEVVIRAWSLVDRTELATVRARVVTLDRSNRIIEVRQLRAVDPASP